jgi:hypothetical protein
MILIIATGGNDALSRASASTSTTIGKDSIHVVKDTSILSAPSTQSALSAALRANANTGASVISTHPLPSSGVKRGVTSLAELEANMGKKAPTMGTTGSGTSTSAPIAIPTVSTATGGGGGGPTSQPSSNNVAWSPPSTLATSVSTGPPMVMQPPITVTSGPVPYPPGMSPFPYQPFDQSSSGAPNGNDRNGQGNDRSNWYIPLPTQRADSMSKQEIASVIRNQLSQLQSTGINKASCDPTLFSD